MRRKVLIVILVSIIIISLGIIFFPDVFRGEEQNSNTEDRTNNQQNETEDFTLNDLEGASVSLSDFRGRRVFLSFWTTWCRACSVAMPYINEIYMQNHDIEIITINLREDVRTIEGYMERNNYEFRVLLDTNGRIGNRYRASAIPFSVLIDEEGNISRTQLGAMNKEQLIEFMGLEE